MEKVVARIKPQMPRKVTSHWQLRDRRQMLALCPAGSMALLVFPACRTPDI